MKAPYPLLFEPIPRVKEFWGGYRLVTLLGKDFEVDAPIGESWEISDVAGFESVVRNGVLAGKSLREIVLEDASAVVGDERIVQGGRFPLLVKYIDAHQTLSVQAHPPDDYAREHERSFGKEEAWYILHADAGAKLIRGVTRGTTREKLAKAIQKGDLTACLHTFEPSPGDVIHIPAGMLHAIGAGILLAEIQQTSDVTYRAYDWNRVDKDGKPLRELHVGKVLDIVRCEAPRRDTVELRLLQDGPSKRYEAIRTGKLALEVLEVAGELDDAPPPGRFVILNVVEGDAELEYAGGRTRLPLGTTILIPASLPPYVVRSEKATLLRSCVP